MIHNPEIEEMYELKKIIDIELLYNILKKHKKIFKWIIDGDRTLVIQSLGLPKDITDKKLYEAIMNDVKPTKFNTFDYIINHIIPFDDVVDGIKEEYREFIKDPSKYLDSSAQLEIVHITDSSKSKMMVKKGDKQDVFKILKKLPPNPDELPIPDFYLSRTNSKSLPISEKSVSIKRISPTNSKSSALEYVKHNKSVKKLKKEKV
jgi:hypothetical protein